MHDYLIHPVSGGCNYTRRSVCMSVCMCV
jgi:hypothetical protein